MSLLTTSALAVFFYALVTTERSDGLANKRLLERSGRRSYSCSMALWEWLFPIFDPGRSLEDIETHKDKTTVDPLNLALKAKSNKACLWWSFVTIGALISLIFIVGVLVVKYGHRDTAVLTKLKNDRIPFPAVTFCNMNPYKKSVLAAVPEIAALLNSFLNTSFESGVEVSTSGVPTTDTLGYGIRKKRHDANSERKPERDSVGKGIAALGTSLGQIGSIKHAAQPSGWSRKNASSVLAVPQSSGNTTTVAPGTRRPAIAIPSGLSKKKNATDEKDEAEILSKSSSVAAVPTMGAVRSLRSSHSDSTSKATTSGSTKTFSLGHVEVQNGRDNDMSTTESLRTVEMVSSDSEALGVSEMLKSSEISTTPGAPLRSVGTDQSGPSGTTITLVDKNPSTTTGVPLRSTKTDQEGPVSKTMTRIGKDLSSTPRPDSATSNTTLLLDKESSMFNHADFATASTGIHSSNLSYLTKAESENSRSSTTDAAEGAQWLAVKEYIGNALDNVSKDASAASVTSQDMMAFVMASLPGELAAKAGYNVTELIIRCVFGDAHCGIKDFRLLVDASYGNCFTFNAIGQYMMPRRAGMTEGLVVTYAVGQDEYMDFVQAAGVRVIIHDQDETVLPDVSGINVPTGFQATATIRRAYSKAMASHKRPCISSVPEVPTFNYANTAYSAEACLRSCYQASVMERCHCGDPRIPLPVDANVTYCNVTKRDCVNAFYTVASTTGKRCYCPPACKITVYDITLTTSKWSHTLGGDIETVLGHNASLNMKNRLSRITVYYDDLAIVEYIERPVYGISDILYDTSNVFGLLLGVSVLTTFELIHLSIYLFKKMYRCPECEHSVPPFRYLYIPVHEERVFIRRRTFLHWTKKTCAE